MFSLPVARILREEEEIRERLLPRFDPSLHPEKDASHSTYTDHLIQASLRD